MENEKDVQTREVLALLIYSLASGPITQDRMEKLVQMLGFDWAVLSNWARRTGTGELGKKGVIKK